MAHGSREILVHEDREDEQEELSPLAANQEAEREQAGVNEGKNLQKSVPQKSASGEPHPARPFLQQAWSLQNCNTNSVPSIQNMGLWETS